MAEQSEEQLIARARVLDEAAWGTLYDRHYRRLFDYCFVRTGDRPASEDLAADVFHEAVRGIGKYHYRGVPFAAWLFRIARNLTADHLERARRRPQLQLSDEVAAQDDRVSADPEILAQWSEVRRALDKLTEDQQQVIILRFFQGLSHEETAQAMGRRSGAVRVLQTRALKTLRRLLAEGEG
jgi:RNA polymerase sigma-70 factor (ECF subfamily)